eukprot:Opistho-2@42076
MARPVSMSTPAITPFWCSSRQATITSCASCPAFWASTLGIMRMASAYACTPRRARPLTSSELHEIAVKGNLECTGAGNDRAVLNSILHCTESIVDGILDLRERIRVGTLDDNGNRLGVLDILHKCELLLAQSVLIDKAGVSKTVGSQLIDRVHGGAAARENEALHVAALRTAQGNDTLLCEHIEGDGVDSLLVDDHKSLLGALAHLPLELDNLAHALVGKRTLGNHHPITLLGALVKEARVHLALLILERHVARENVRILCPLLHVRVACAVIKHEALDELRVEIRLVTHLHNLNHVKVDGLSIAADGEDGVDNTVREHIGQLAVNLCPE